MGYFPNGTSGDCFRDSYCWKCKNWVDKKDGRGFGCPIWDLHLDYSYELCNSKTIAKKMLDFLIPINKKRCYNEECAMFLKKKEMIEK